MGWPELNIFLALYIDHWKLLTSSSRIITNSYKFLLTFPIGFSMIQKALSKQLLSRGSLLNTEDERWKKILFSRSSGRRNRYKHHQIQDNMTGITAQLKCYGTRLLLENRKLSGSLSDKKRQTKILKRIKQIFQRGNMGKGIDIRP